MAPQEVQGRLGEITAGPRQRRERPQGDLVSTRLEVRVRDAAPYICRSVFIYVLKYADEDLRYAQTSMHSLARNLDQAVAQMI